jgi:phosphoglycerate dehydrogenase-like enzyme
LPKPTAFLVNTARGDIVQKAPLFAAVRGEPVWNRVN